MAAMGSKIIIFQQVCNRAVLLLFWAIESRFAVRHRGRHADLCCADNKRRRHGSASFL